LSLRVKPSIKKMAERRAHECDRSLASYISRLVERDEQENGAVGRLVGNDPSRK
jgi:hypothetical protein